MKPSKLHRTAVLFASMVALAAISLSLRSTAAAAAETFAGKTVTVYVPVAPGGGYDTYARLVARHIRKHLPGQPTVIVKNMPGAGGVILAGHLYTAAAKDGTEFGVLQDANLFQPLTTSQHFPYDVRKFGYLGALEKFVPIVLAWHTTPFRVFDDTKKQTMSVGSDGPGSSTDYFPRVLNAFFGTKFKVVRGYKGSADITLAIERGELDGLSSWCYDCMKAQKPDWVANNSARILLQLALEGDPELDARGVPKVIDLATTAEEKQIAQLTFSGVSIARPFVAPPGLAPERLATLREAFEAAAKARSWWRKRTGAAITFGSLRPIEWKKQSTASMQLIRLLCKRFGASCRNRLGGRLCREAANHDSPAPRAAPMFPRDGLVSS